MSISEDLTELLKKINSSSISEGLIEALNFSVKINNNELKNFCSKEMQGWEPKEGDNLPLDQKAYRMVDTYLVLSKPIHSAFFSTGGSVESFFNYLETTKNISKISMTIIDSVSEIEETIKKATATKYILSSYDISYFLPGESGKVFAYTRIQSYGKVLTGIKNELIKKVLSLQENLKKVEPEKGIHKLNTNIEVIKKVSEGAYGEVWQGRDKRLNRDVAIKALHLSAPSLSNLEEHASALARVKHPNVITVYSIEKIYMPNLKSEVEAIIMEYIEGQTLTDKLGFSLSSSEAKNIGNAILDGLQAIHKVNIAHNDLHSGNIIISNDSSEIKIIDLLYSSEHTFQALSTASIESRLNRDIKDTKYLLAEILENTTDGIEYDDSFKFRKEVKDLQLIQEIKTSFNKIFDIPGIILKPISNTVLANPEILKEITKLISSLNTEVLNLGTYLPKCLEIANETNNEELETFAFNELNGWEKQDLDEFRKEYENYRSISAYFSLTAELNTMAFYGLNETMQILQNDENFHKFNFLITESVTALEGRLRSIPPGSKETLAVIKLPLKYFGVDTGKFSPERIVPIYFPSGSYNHIYSLIRSELVKRLTGLYKKLKTKN
jgi:tRNA A-37 threonylcarbamoyl transferase component Bud32